MTKFRSDFHRWLLLGAIVSLPLSAAAIERPSEGYYASPRVEFSFDEEASVRLDGHDFKSSIKWTYSDVESLLLDAGATNWDRLFSEHSPEYLEQLRKTGEARRGIELPDLNNWYTVVVSSDESAEDLAAQLRKNRHIRSASATPIPKVTAADIAPTTPDFESLQDYHDPAPYGTGIASAWAQPGGDGIGMNVLHCEGGWVLDHEDYDLVHTGGGNSADPDWWNHGTACVSILGSPGNAYGVTGMTPNLDGLYAHGITANGGASAWIAAMASLNVGDVISASWGYSGTPIPGQTCVCNCSQFGGVPAEANQSDFDAIQTVTANGYIVVNSAANGSMDLDHAHYGGIYDLNVRDSGAIMIGAINPGGVPTCWTNFGSRIDAHAWGSSVVSAGYGNLFASGANQYYTNSFSGTSSACPIVSGCISAAQGIFKSTYGGEVLDAWQFRSILRTTGTDQTGDLFKDISNQPDMIQIIAALSAFAPDAVPPVITHAPIGNTYNLGPFAISAQITDDSGIASANLYHRINGGAWVPQGMTFDGVMWNATIPDQGEGSVVEYYLTATDGAGLPNMATSATWSFTVLTEGNGIVLLTPATSATSSGAEWETALISAGYQGVIMNVDNLDGVNLNAEVDALIVLLGIYSNNHVVPAGDPMAIAIETFAMAGGKVYLEGGDCWYFDPVHDGGHEFGPTFGISADADGTSDLATALGHGVLGGSWGYFGENNWIDRLQSAGGDLLFTNDVVGYNCGFTQSGAMTTAGVSFELAGLDGFQTIVETLFGVSHFNVLPGILATSPASLFGTAMEGSFDSDVLTMTNTGHGDLFWIARVAAPVPPPAAAQTVHPDLDLGKYETDPRSGSTIAALGGPDAFGYAWLDSDQPGGPAVNFQDISATGTILNMSDDDIQGPFALGFEFPFYANFFSDAYVCSNGFVSFEPASADFSNDPIPSASSPDGFLAPFWDDFNPSLGGTIHYQAFGDRFIVQWTEMQHFQAIGTYTVQVIIHDDGSIEYQYGDMIGTTNSATVGVENILAAGGLQVVFNDDYIQSNMAIRIAPWMSVDTFSGTLAPGASYDLGAVMDARPLSAGTYHSSVHLSTSGVPAWTQIPAEFVVTPGPRKPAQITDIAITPVDTDGSDFILSFTFQFPDVVEDINGNPVVVDHYTLYWGWSPYGVFPADWYSAGSNAVSEFIEVSALISVQDNLYFIITAVDEDGVLLASSHSGVKEGIVTPMVEVPVGGMPGQTMEDFKFGQ